MKEGTLIKLEKAEGFKAKPGALAITVDGQSRYPDLYKKLYDHIANSANMTVEDADQFIWVEWIKTSPLWNGQEDGAAAAFRFKEIKASIHT